MHDMLLGETTSASWRLNKIKADVLSTPMFYYCKQTDISNLKVVADVSELEKRNLTDQICDSASNADISHQVRGFKFGYRPSVIDIKGVCFGIKVVFYSSFAKCLSVQAFQLQIPPLPKEITPAAKSFWSAGTGQKPLFICALLLGMLAMMTSIGFLSLLFSLYRIRKSLKPSSSLFSLSQLSSFNELSTHSNFRNRSFEEIKSETYFNFSSGISTMSSPVSEGLEAEIVLLKRRSRTYENICLENPSINQQLKKDCKHIAAVDESSVHWSSEEDSTFSTSTQQISIVADANEVEAGAQDSAITKSFSDSQCISNVTAID
uniref:Peptidase S72 domain-containing protein n=1 Tax=Syphacia muris TaxID=451379 RepID=A0A0N5AWR0_9BILA